MNRLESVARRVIDPADQRACAATASWWRANESARKKDWGGALHAFQGLYDAVAKWDPSDEYFLAFICLRICECQTNLRDYEEAAEALTKAQVLIRRSGDVKSSDWTVAAVPFAVSAWPIVRDLEKKLAKQQRDRYVVAHSPNEYAAKLRRVEYDDCLLTEINLVPETQASAQELRFNFSAMYGAGVFIGDYVVLNAADKKFLAQIEDDRLEESRVRYSGTLLRPLSGESLLLELHDDIERYSFSGARVELASPFVLHHYLSKPIPGNVPLVAGILSQVYAHTPVPVVLNHTGLGQHTALFGESGSGKSFALGRLLEEILLKTALRIILIDPNSDYRNLRHLQSKDIVLTHWRTVNPVLSSTGDDPEFSFDPSQDYESMQEWLKERGDGLLAFTPTELSRETGATTEAKSIALRLSDFGLDQQIRLLHLDQGFHADQISAYRDLVMHFGNDNYTLSDLEKLAYPQIAHNPVVREVLVRLQTAHLPLVTMAAKAAGGTCGSRYIVDELMRTDWRLFELDIGELKPANRLLTVLAILDRFWRERNDCQARPTLLVIDEAHHVVPREPEQNEAAALVDIVNEIAGEGRKDGIFLLIVSQSPGKIHPFTLSQCSNLILMKMRYESDLATLRDAFSQVPSRMIDQARNFSAGEALVVGEKLIRSPVRLRFAPRRTKEGREPVTF